MGPICLSAVLMGALTAGLVAADIWFRHSDRVLTHALYGSIATTIFYMLCVRGYESVNWVLLALLPVYIIFTLIFVFFSGDNSYRRDREEQECEADTPPQPTRKPCGCHVDTECKCNTKPKGCPVNPITLESECGISRYT
jgi:hypothetical protein